MAKINAQKFFNDNLIVIIQFNQQQFDNDMIVKNPQSKPLVSFGDGCYMFKDVYEVYLKMVAHEATNVLKK